MAPNRQEKRTQGSGVVMHTVVEVAQGRMLCRKGPIVYGENLSGSADGQDGQDGRDGYGISNTQTF